jgi:hypothetical protein
MANHKRRETFDTHGFDKGIPLLAKQQTGYYRQRLHSALGYRSPEEFEQQIKASASAESRSATMVFFENSENDERVSTELLGKGTQTPSPSPDPIPC